MKVEFLKPVKGYAHVPGDVCEMDNESARALIEAGFLLQAKPEEKTENAKSKDKTENAKK